VPASPTGKGFVEFLFLFYFLFIYFKDVGEAVVGEMSDFGRAIMAKNFEKLIFGGLHEKHAVTARLWYL
jgi:hypothetical protein